MIVSRYVFKNLLGITCFIALILTLLIMLTQSLRFLELIVETGAPVSSFFKLILLAVPRFLEVILPLSAVISILFIYNKMTTDNELVVLRAAGFPQFTLIRPALFLVLSCVGIMLFLTLWGTPTTHNKMETLRDTIRAQYASLLIREGVFNEMTQGLTVYVRGRAPNGDISGIVIHDARDRSAQPITFVAKTGRLISTAEDDAVKITVYDGRRQQRDLDTKAMNTLSFQEYTLEATDLKSDTKLNWKEPDERTIFELLSPNRQDTRDIKNASAFETEVHRRIMTSAAVITFSMIGLCCLLIGGFNRRGQTRRILLGMTLVILLQSLYLGLNNIIEKDADRIWLYYCAVIIPAVGGLALLTPFGDSVPLKIKQLLRRGE